MHGFTLAACSPTTPSQGYHEYINENLPPESPYLYGLHPNAEIGFLTVTSEKLFRTVLEMQPKETNSGAGTGVSREEKAGDLTHGPGPKGRAWNLGSKSAPPETGVERELANRPRGAAQGPFPHPQASLPAASNLAQLVCEQQGGGGLLPNSPEASEQPLPVSLEDPRGAHPI